MKNSLVFLLMILLPLQTAWGVAALFCQHENSTTSWHWGHHQHQVNAACLSAHPQNLAAADDQNKTIATLSAFGDDKTKAADQPHAFQMANHSDHLQTNPLGLNPSPQLQALLPFGADILVVPLSNNLPLFYQTPYLEQPKPPLWSA